jgi:7-cyano-7-deazaguanine synthase in queuosine biosynthesis
MTITYHNYHTIRIPVPDTYQRIGIAMSGGLDSTLLAKLLLPFLDITRVTVYTVDLKKSVDAVKHILNTLNATVNHVVLPDPKNPNGALSSSFTEVSKDVDYFYTGTTTNPPWAFEIPAGQKPMRYCKEQYQNMFMPFGATTKEHLVELFMSTDASDLLSLTHTCTQRPQGSAACGSCFACRERIWAFAIANYVDCVTYE